MVNITSKSNTPAELEIVEAVKSLYEKYDIPTYTQNIVVESKAVPHAYPILTLNTRVKDPLLLLQTVTHEQLHWWATAHPRYSDCIEYLKIKYLDDGEHNKSGTYPDSYWEHIIVCFNTRLCLERMLSQEDVSWIYERWQAYPTLEKEVVSKRQEIRDNLEKFGLLLS